ncbi:2-dehydropantoate 2-reductase [Lentibacter algarum]|uniref:2-dehydropantoate 2-reductase n=1 Tax=Lentibacter algarum TaxID=576131 RepID=UPI001C07E08C|nr:2-dehydropantoate 2-reductase [Lentibacter algarum]
MSKPDTPVIAVVGAGAIGCFVGGLLSVAGRDVHLLARRKLASSNLHLTGFDGLDARAAPEVMNSPEALANADVVLVCVKSGATAEVGQMLAKHAPKTTVIVSLQNGLQNAETLRAELSGHDVRAAVVGFNVVALGAGRFHRSVSGEVFVEAGTGDIAALLDVAGLPVKAVSDIEAVQRGKLILNLTNALNALSGLSLREMLLTRSWRRVMASQMREALDVFKAAEQVVHVPAPVPAWLVPWVLRLPDVLFERVAKQMLTVDAQARTSMVADLAAGKMTEVDQLQGEIIRLGALHNVPTPVAAQVSAFVKEAETGGRLPRNASEIAL